MDSKHRELFDMKQSVKKVQIYASFRPGNSLQTEGDTIRYEMLF